jgi:hypothetical protein
MVTRRQAQGNPERPARATVIPSVRGISLSDIRTSEERASYCEIPRFARNDTSAQDERGLAAG